MWFSFKLCNVIVKMYVFFQRRTHLRIEIVKHFVLKFLNKNSNKRRHYAKGCKVRKLQFVHFALLWSNRLSWKLAFFCCRSKIYSSSGSSQCESWNSLLKRRFWPSPGGTMTLKMYIFVRLTRIRAAQALKTQWWGVMTDAEVHYFSPYRNCMLRG